ncbi:HET-domain-containing protein [Rhizopogon vinicolor AM-OR11-026]|uniref:HET-domain-containing protein n=1 Tax=Rhizopogon vinicolor AM-OR11-026 TaxID=1314800 RepID=A0A1B7MV32_9AGAM|nr:HET-domain-containing protein [Rhizopogon vinicolor AM-OR11-026]
MQSIIQSNSVSSTVEDGTLELYPDEWGASSFDPTNERKVLDLFDHYVANHMPAHLIYLGPGSQRRIVGREELATFIKPRTPQNGEIAKIKSRQDAIRELVKPALDYAIFSHRWCREGEPTFDDIRNGREYDNDGFQKLSKFCEKAREMGYKLAWSDTCCIDKTSSVELDEAIRSMFRWYRNAAICIVHLAESLNVEQMKNDPWFTRGWTLQELLAPLSIKFFNKQWSPMLCCMGLNNDKNDDPFMSDISTITGIPIPHLRHFSPGLNHIREKMVWASKRTTTRIEDAAYSLVGIFDVSVPTAYGEGERAFHRLVEAITERCDEWEMFAWAGPSSSHEYSTAIPRSPRCYSSFDASNFPQERKDAQNVEVHGDRNFVFMREGLQIKLAIRSGDLKPHHGGTYQFVEPPRPGMTASFAPVVVQTSRSMEDNYEFALGIVNYERTEQRGKESGMLYPQKNYLCFLLGRSKEEKVFHKVNTSNVLTVRTTFQGWGSFEPLVTVWL